MNRIGKKKNDISICTNYLTKPSRILFGLLSFISNGKQHKFASIYSLILIRETLLDAKLEFIN